MYPLDPRIKQVTCAFCIKKATHYIVNKPMFGDLLAVCKHCGTQYDSDGD